MFVVSSFHGLNGTSGQCVHQPAKVKSVVVSFKEFYALWNGSSLVLGCHTLKLMLSNSLFKVYSILLSAHL